MTALIWPSCILPSCFGQVYVNQGCNDKSCPLNTHRCMTERYATSLNVTIHGNNKVFLSKRIVNESICGPRLPNSTLLAGTALPADTRQPTLQFPQSLQPLPLPYGTAASGNHGCRSQKSIAMQLNYQNRWGLQHWIPADTWEIAIMKGHFTMRWKLRDLQLFKIMNYDPLAESMLQVIGKGSTLMVSQWCFSKPQRGHSGTEFLSYGKTFFFFPRAMLQVPENHLDKYMDKSE